MKIKRLEITGFKSFVEKTVLDFTSDISAIVGPNGCGKSNVVDAIRWVMGEQSVKHLRGKMMEDVIFGGSDSRKPLGMAEVAIIFSTNDGNIPAKYLNYPEIEITRRLYRDGESEYLINRTQCRLMDITELFMDTGVGTKAYSIIEQGRIGMILLSKPEERRFLIEEAAGVTKYKARKHIAMKKVETTKQNLLRLADIVSEIKRQLSSLQRQAAKAEKFKQLRAELKEIDLAVAGKDFLEISSQLEVAEIKLKLLSNELTANSIESENLELEAETARLAITEGEEALRYSNENLFTLKGKCQESSSTSEVAREKIRSLMNSLAALDKEKEQAAADIEKASKESEDAKKSASQITLESSEDDTELTLLNSRLAERIEEEKSVAAKVEDARKHLFSLQSEISRHTNQKTSAQKRIFGVSERLARQHKELAECEERVDLSKRKLADSEKDVEIVSIEMRDAATELENLNFSLGISKKEIAALDEAISSIKGEVSRVDARLHSLRNLEKQYAGFGEGVKKLMTSENERSLFYGVAADFIQTGKEYETALEALLSDRLQYIIPKGSDSVKNGVNFLSKNSGRASFIASKPVIKSNPKKPDGCIPFLELVTISPDFRDLIEPLLYNAYLAENFDEIIELCSLHPESVFATRSGETGFLGGILSAGSGKSSGSGIVQVKREIRELDSSYKELKQKHDELLESKEKLKALYTSQEENSSLLRQKVHSLEMRLLSSQKDAQRHKDELKRSEERTAVIRLEENQLSEEIDSLNLEIADSDARTESARLMVSGKEREYSELSAALTFVKNDIDSIKKESTELQVRIAASNEKKNAALQSVERFIKEYRKLEERLQFLSGEEIRMNAELLYLRKTLEENEVKVAEMILSVQEAEELLSIQHSSFDSMQAKASSITDKSVMNRKGGEELKNSISSCSLAISELKLKESNIETVLLERYRMTIPELLENAQEKISILSHSDEKREKLKKRVEELGEVNLTAIDEYAEISKRHDFLVEQKNDLEMSLNSLQHAIQKINRTTRKRFIETFNSINEKFKGVFPRLFCGGSAELKLTNEDDLLETGVEIIVQPPGKRVQNVTLLSGGEKALTAVALIFSIFLIKPSPFCLLDEVDAPLDDANIGRFNDMIREMSSFSQFILITHSKTTMAVADTLYGVTMEEAGVSKLVSVKMT